MSGGAEWFIVERREIYQGGSLAVAKPSVSGFTHDLPDMTVVFRGELSRQR